MVLIHGEENKLLMGEKMSQKAMEKLNKSLESRAKDQGLKATSEPQVDNNIGDLKWWFHDKKNVLLTPEHGLNFNEAAEYLRNGYLKKMAELGNESE
jgi:hypothetical protein